MPAGNVVVVIDGGNVVVIVIVVDFEPAVAVITAVAVELEARGTEFPLARGITNVPAAGAL